VSLSMSALASGQSQVNNSQPASTKSPDDSAALTKPPRIEGVVMDDRYSRPLKRGYVVLKPTGPGRASRARPDDAGKFSSKTSSPVNMPSSAPDGYVSANWDAVRHPHAPGVPAPGGQEVGILPSAWNPGTSSMARSTSRMATRQRRTPSFCTASSTIADGCSTSLRFAPATTERNTGSRDFRRRLHHRRHLQQNRSSRGIPRTTRTRSRRPK